MYNITQRFCERCERLTQDGHLWCQDRDCPAEEGWPVFQYGDYLADLKITRLVSVWRTAALYEAERGGEKNKQTVFVKVAHATPECEQRLRDETRFLTERLNSIAPKPKRGFANFLHGFRPKPPRPLLLQWLPPSPLGSSVPYGETTIKGIPRVFAVYDARPGVTLREAMLENPQVWHYESAWVTLVIAEAMRGMVDDKRLHLSISPRVVLIDIDEEGHWRPLLLDLGWLMPAADAAKHLPLIFTRLDPPYTAPEVVADRRGTGLSLSADVFSLGIVYFEMLAGRPGVVQQFRRDDTLIRDVVGSAQKQQALPLAQDKFRPELNQAGVVSVVESAIGTRERAASVSAVQSALAGIYGNPPPEKRRMPIRSYIALVLFVGLLATVAVIVLRTLLASR
jgi:hypothetical protein